MTDSVLRRGGTSGHPGLYDHGDRPDPRVRAPGEPHPFTTFLGIRDLHEPEPGRCLLHLDLRADLLNDSGALQGGVIATLIDFVGGTAGRTSLGGRVAATADLGVQFLAAARHGPVRAEATVVKAGRLLAVSQCRVVDVGAGDRVVAIGTVTMAVTDRSAAGPPAGPGGGRGSRA